MSAKGSQDANEGGGKGWNDAEKYALVIRIIDIYQSTHGKFDHKRLAAKYPERTPKALQHQWTRVLQEIRDLGDGDTVPPSTGRKKAAAPRKTAAKAAGDDDDDDDGEGDLTPIKPKRGRKPATKAAVDDGEGEGDLTPLKPKRGRKPAAKVAVDDGDDGEGDLTPIKPKRGRKRAAVGVDDNGEGTSAKKQRAVTAADDNTVAEEKQDGEAADN